MGIIRGRRRLDGIRRCERGEHLEEKRGDYERGESLALTGTTAKKSFRGHTEYLSRWLV
jgi:hypothetical protein